MRPISLHVHVINRAGWLTESSPRVCLCPAAAPGADPNADISPQLIRMRGWLLRIVRAMEL